MTKPPLQLGLSRLYLISSQIVRACFRPARHGAKKVCLFGSNSHAKRFAGRTDLLRESPERAFAQDICRRLAQALPASVFQKPIQLYFFIAIVSIGNSDDKLRLSRALTIKRQGYSKERN
jgi:hypothetical protein